MDDKLKILWNLDVLVKMCRSKGDGPSLRVEESELITKIRGFQQEITELNSLSDEDNYDMSAEMADRNIEIITKKQLQTLKNQLKEKNNELSSLKEAEASAYENTNLLRETKTSYEKYIQSLQERVVSISDNETIDRYNQLMNDTSANIKEVAKKLKEESKDYDNIQDAIIKVTQTISKIEETIEKKKKLLSETQKNLENKENYIDRSRKEKTDKRVKELEAEIDTLSKRLEEIRKDPKYIDTKIKDIINNGEDPTKAKSLIASLVNIVIRQPYINVPDDNKLEEELLKATRARDTFASEIDQKSYNILESNTPEKTRITFLENRIEKWQEELTNLEEKVALIDQDSIYSYKDREQEINDMIATMKEDLVEFQKAYDNTPAVNISLKASLKVSLEEKREDIIEAEKIAVSFRNDEAKDIDTASYVIKVECEEIKNNILLANKEISNLKNRLLSKKTGAIDISSRNRDKEALKELAQTVIDLKHRRQFPDTPLEVVRRLEEELKITLTDAIDMNVIEESKEIVNKNYDKYIEETAPTISNIEDEEEEVVTEHRGIRVVTEDALDDDELIELEEVIVPKEIETPEEIDEPETSQEAEQEENIDSTISEVSDNSVNENVQLIENPEINNTEVENNGNILIEETA